MQEQLKVVIVGDGTVGKTTFLNRWANDFFNTYMLNCFDTKICVVDGKEVSVTLWDTAGQDDYDRLRRLSYPDTDIFFVAFCVTSQTSFERIKEKWIPEVRHYCPNIPVLLLGLQCDLRGQEVNGRGCTEVPRKDALQLAKDLGAVGYYETSSLTKYGVMEAMDACVRVGLTQARTSRSGGRRHRFVLPWKRGSRSSDQSFSTNASKPYIPPPPQLPQKKRAPAINVPSSTFAADWSKMINNPSHSDVVFRLEGKTYHAHRYVLASASDLFRQLLGVTQELKVDSLCDGCGRARLNKVTMETVNSGQLEGMLHIEARLDLDGRQLMEVTFDPSIVTELALTRVLTFLYTGVMELGKESECIDETIKISQLLNLPELELVCENARKGEEYLIPIRNTSITKQLFLNKELFSDVCFLVEGVVVPAHRLVLTTRCEVMSAMLSGAFQESTANQISVPDIPLDTFVSFLEYLYTDHAPIEEGDSMGILELANRYMMSRLMSLCELYISKHVERATKDFIAKANVDIIGLLLSSQLHNASQLSSWCLHFISSNFNVLEANEQFLQLGEDNLSYVEEHRWPPLSYETAMNEYKTKYLDTEGEESGNPLNISDDGAAVKSH
ncbi:rho-related protein racA-like isoform X2 [Halichondria panicea]|uniref:rho-related protein racA-like isoform X2 n=1 Tax=Halichondria panicea TaxID=6063 RepID=UPI00312B98AF